MVGNPGSSARCLQCRQRKKKCGLEAPSCLRCLEKGLVCSGPANGTVFIHRNADNVVVQSDRAALHAAFKTRRTRSRRVSTRQGQDPSAPTTIKAVPALFDPTNLEVVDRLLNTSSTHMLYASIADEFKPRPQIGIFSGDRLAQDKPMYSGFAISIRALIPLASLNIKLLDLGLFSVLTKYIGMLRNNDQLVNLARSSYTKALGQLHKNLNRDPLPVQSSCCDDQVRQTLISLCLAMQLFELTEQTQANRSLEAHVNGALSILQTMNPRLYRTPRLRHTFGGLRWMAVFVALRRRQDVFLAGADWSTVPFQGSQMSRVELLHDLALQLPALLERTDNLIKQQKNISVQSEASSLLEGYLTLKRGFDDWLQDLKDELGQLYWFSRQEIHGAEPLVDTDPVCIPLFPDRTFLLRFANGARAGLLVNYWSFQLELLMGLLSFWKNEETSAYVRNFHQDHVIPDLELYAKEAQTLALLILEATPYLSSCLEGRIVAQGPLEIVSRHFDHYAGTGVYQRLVNSEV